jgi:hypothetical protein
MNGAAMQTAERAEELVQVSVRLPADLSQDINARAKELSFSLNRTIVQLLRSGIENEQNKKRLLEEKLRLYREATNQEEIKRLGDELGAMLFGK